MTKIYGINSPEFFDPRLFRQFIEALKSEGSVAESDDGKLCYEPILTDVVRAAQGVISAEFRQAVSRPRQ